MRKIFDVMITVAIYAMIAWVVISVFDVSAHNLPSASDYGNFHAWNIFYAIFK